MQSFLWDFWYLYADRPKRDPQIFRLDTDVSYDATNLFMWAVLVACLAAGWFEAAMVLGGLKMLGSGRRAARAD
jgi:hypothetical protein